ncbi:MAG: helix-turn-helix transcriptional regulator [Candidatus Dojkabacteria bacterium]
MDNKYILGNRIRAFRKRAGISQFDLELGIGTSPGGLSRIENGEVNPTKETVIKIADFLKLTNQESQYLYGNWFYPATKEEVVHATEDTNEYFSKKGVLAYILDERFRCIAISRSFQKLLNLTDSQVEEAFLQPLISILIDDKFNIKSFIPVQAFEEVLKNLLASFYADCGYMEDDEVYNQQIRSINSDPLARRLWKVITNQSLRKYNDVNTRRVILRIGGVNVTMNFIRDPLYRNRRFEIIEYRPSHPFLKLVTKLVT